MVITLHKLDLSNVNNLLPGEYEISSPKRGGFSTVWRVQTKDTHHPNKVMAVKEMDLGQAEIAEMAFKEVFLLSQIDHPNIINITSVMWRGQSNALYVCMPWYDQSLAALMKRGSVINPDKMLYDVCLGLRRLELNGVRHGDVTPPNILYDEKTGNYLLADFGNARYLDMRLGNNIVCYTPRYVAPEVLEARTARAITPSSDLYSLGVIYYECLFKKRFCGTDPSIAETIRNNPLLGKMLAPIPGRRFQSFHELLCEFDEDLTL